MPQTTMTSTQFTVNWNDVLKGLIIAVITPVFTIIMQSLNAGSLTFDWKAIAVTALAAALSYILKNFLTPARIIITDAETVKSVKEGDAQVKVIGTK